MEPPTVREIIKRLKDEGWVIKSINGDHRKYTKDGAVVIVSGKMSDHAKPGTYANIKKAAGW